MSNDIDYLSAYESLYMVRRAEEEVVRLYPTDKIKSPVHLSIGQEVISVAVCKALTSSDIVFGTYRSHALYLAKTGDLNGFFAELYGKITGCCRGKGGSMHLASVSEGMMGTSAVVATTIPQAVGYAYAAKLRGEKTAVAVFFGDGATEEGVFHESLNFAALKKLPIIFICENNQYAIHTHQSARQYLSDISAISRAHGIESVQIEDSSFDEIYMTVKGVREKFNLGDVAPIFIECATSRWKEHVGPGEDFNLGFREISEVYAWKKNDQLIALSEMIGFEAQKSIETRVDKAIAKAIQFAEDSPFPLPSELYEGVFAPRVNSPEGSRSDIELNFDRDLSYSAAIHEAFEQEMGANQSVILYGLDVDDPKAILGTTKGLQAKFGKDRVFGTPLAEDAMTGVGIGMALARLRPIHIHIRMDFLMLAMNQLINMAAKCRYVFGSQVSVPMVIRAIIGRSWGQGAQHSQAFHSYFMHVPGIKVVAPSNPFDAKGCMIASIRDENPVIFVEHRLLHNQIGPVPQSSYEVEPGKARITIEGSDVTLVGISFMQFECQKAAVYLRDKGIAAEVIDPIWLSPLDIETISKSVRKTKRLIIVDNGWTTCGASAEIASLVSECLEGESNIVIRRMGFAPVTCPTTPSLEEGFYIGAIDIASLAFQITSTSKENWRPEIKPDLRNIEFKGPF